MAFLKVFTILALLFVLLGTTIAENRKSRRNGARSLVRVQIPWLGLGRECASCPQHYCDDDPAIILGYCCGCASLIDHIPVRCPPYSNCPANTYSLCEDYEYMMYCCC